MTSRRSGRLRAALRFVGAVMITSGALLIADAAVTLAWQEPLSALLAKREQAELGDWLAEAEEQAAAERAAFGRGRHGRRLLAALAGRHARRLRRNDPVGRIELPTLGRSYVVVEGTGRGTLRKGPGHYPRTPLPGQRGTVGVAGHRTTYLAPFRTVNRLRRGEPVVIAMPYGRFTYEVRATRIVPPTATWVVRRAPRDRLVLTACHPLYSASQRIVVFATLVGAEPVPSDERSRASSSRISPTTRASEIASTASQ